MSDHRPCPSSPAASPGPTRRHAGAARRAGRPRFHRSTRRRCAASPRPSPLPASTSRLPLPARPRHVGRRHEDHVAGPTGLAEAEAAYQRVAARSTKVVVAGLSMGGALTLRLGADHPEIAGLVCINPADAAVGARWSPSCARTIDGGHRRVPGHRQRHRRPRPDRDRLRRHAAASAAVADGRRTHAARRRLPDDAGRRCC